LAKLFSVSDFLFPRNGFRESDSQNHVDSEDIKAFAQFPRKFELSDFEILFEFLKISMFSSQEIGSSLISFEIIFEALGIQPIYIGRLTL